ncbi:MAG: putative porin, partial [Candidatus Hydrogenedentes bacterium]|nr:putative porin [Candidatus Hydrogenedentota bacterium]
MEEALEQLGTALQHDESISPELRKALGGLVEALMNERTEKPPGLKEISQKDVAPAVDEYLEAKGKSGMKPGLVRFTDRLEVFGDARLRYEESFKQDTRRDRTRFRTRLRLGGNYRLTEDLAFGTRLTTGNLDDPNSPHHTFGTAFDSLELSLDRIFLAYTPHRVEGLKVRAGKFGHSFYSNPVYGELLWDADVQPEGLATTYRIGDKGRLDHFDITAGYYILLEQSGGDDAYIAVLQAAGQVRLSDNLNANLAVGYYFYDDVSPSGSSTLLEDNSGNRTGDLNGDGSPDDFLS